MADYGLIIKNNNQEIQIDSKYRNLSLDEEGTSVSISNGDTPETLYTRISITSSTLVPLMLIRPNTDNFVAIRNYHKNGSDFDGIDIVTKYGQNTTIDWKSYRENRVASGESYGLLVYNSSGDLCFDSGKSYFKIFSVHTINLAAPSSFGDGDYEDVTHTGISNPYYILSPNSSYTYARYIGQQGVFAIEYFMIGMKKLSATSVRVGWFPFANELSSYAPLDQSLNPTMKLIVCDVT